MSPWSSATRIRFLSRLAHVCLEVALGGLCCISIMMLGRLCGCFGPPRTGAPGCSCGTCKVCLCAAKDAKPAKADNDAKGGTEAGKPLPDKQENQATINVGMH